MRKLIILVFSVAMVASPVVAKNKKRDIIDNYERYSDVELFKLLVTNDLKNEFNTEVGIKRVLLKRARANKKLAKKMVQSVLDEQVPVKIRKIMLKKIWKYRPNSYEDNISFLKKVFKKSNSVAIQRLALKNLVSQSDESYEFLIGLLENANKKKKKMAVKALGRLASHAYKAGNMLLVEDIQTKLIEKTEDGMISVKLCSRALSQVDDRLQKNKIKKMLLQNRMQDWEDIALDLKGHLSIKDFVAMFQIVNRQKKFNRDKYRVFCYLVKENLEVFKEVPNDLDGEEITHYLKIIHLAQLEEIPYPVQGYIKDLINCGNDKSELWAVKVIHRYLKDRKIVLEGLLQSSTNSLVVDFLKSFGYRGEG